MKLKPALPPKTINYGSLNLPTLQKAVNQIVDNNQFPPPLAQWVAISVANASMHALINVRNPRGFLEPSSIYVLIAASSGEGKSPIERILKKDFSQFEATERARHSEKMQAYKEQLQLFDVARQAIATDLRRAINDGGDLEAAEAALMAHMRRKPVRPKAFRPSMEYVTPEALIKLMAEDIPVFSLSSSESAALMRGRTFGALEIFNQAWSGGPLSVDTKKDGNLNVPWCRLSMGLMTQPEPLARFLSGKGQHGMENGFFARLLVCDPGSTQGSRFVQNGTASWEHCDAFAKRTEQLLTETAIKIREEGYEPEVLDFSSEAAAHFFEVHNGIEAEICTGGRYERASDHATKLSSNIARVAATLHRFEGFEGSISLETLKAAQILCEDASADYLKLFVPPPREVQDALALDKWFDDYRNRGISALPLNYARQHCPNALRKEGRFYVALDVLLAEGIVKKYIDEKNIQMISLYPETYHRFPYSGIGQFGGRVGI